MHIVAAQYPSPQLKRMLKGNVRVVGWPDISTITTKWDKFFEEQRLGPLSGPLRDLITAHSFRWGKANGSDPFEVTIMYAALGALFHPNFRYYKPIKNLVYPVPLVYFEEILERLSEEYRHSPFVKEMLRIWHSARDPIVALASTFLEYQNLWSNIHQLRIQEAIKQRPDVLVVPKQLGPLAQAEATSQHIEATLETLDESSLKGFYYPVPPLIL
ncbi:MAG: hypothetical protein GXN92_03035 [Candidatus Micrarchaeota archaeon]|nr:hypothetical protein [Candidatus Micrarchaeota archaeon]